jgi:hypothetical protein
MSKLKTVDLKKNMIKQVEIGGKRLATDETASYIPVRKHRRTFVRALCACLFKDPDEDDTSTVAYVSKVGPVVPVKVVAHLPP